MKDDRVITPQVRTGWGWGPKEVGHAPPDRAESCPPALGNAEAGVESQNKPHVDLFQEPSWFALMRTIVPFKMRKANKNVLRSAILLGALQLFGMSSGSFEWISESGFRPRE